LPNQQIYCSHIEAQLATVIVTTNVVVVGEPQKTSFHYKFQKQKALRQSCDQDTLSF